MNGFEERSIKAMESFKGCNREEAIDALELVAQEELNGNYNSPFHIWRARREKRELIASMGLKRVVGALGGVYYE